MIYLTVHQERPEAHCKVALRVDIDVTSMRSIDEAWIEPVDHVKPYEVACKDELVDMIANLAWEGQESWMRHNNRDFGFHNSVFESNKSWPLGRTKKCSPPESFGYPENLEFHFSGEIAT